MASDLLNVQVDSEPRPVRDVDVAIAYLDSADHDLLLPRLVELVENFVNEEVGDRGVELHARRRAYRPLRAMRRDHGIVRIGEICDLTRGEDSAEIQRLGLKNADR